jgi:hypothetical protein
MYGRLLSKHPVYVNRKSINKYMSTELLLLNAGKEDLVPDSYIFNLKNHLSGDVDFSLFTHEEGVRGG